MALPIVAVVGRPNVGKSTFVNRIVGGQDAIVHEMRGVTRDRSYHEADWNGVHFTLIDTGGIEMGNDDAFQESIRNQAVMATQEADAVVFLVDGRTGAAPDDLEVARILKRSGKPVVLAVNKMDAPGKEDGLWEFYSLGLGDPGRSLRSTATARAICSTRSSATSKTSPSRRKRMSIRSTSRSSAVRTRARAR